MNNLWRNYIFLPFFFFNVFTLARSTALSQGHFSIFMERSPTIIGLWTWLPPISKCKCIRFETIYLQDIKNGDREHHRNMKDKQFTCKDISGYRSSTITSNKAEDLPDFKDDMIKWNNCTWRKMNYFTEAKQHQIDFKDDMIKWNNFTWRKMESFNEAKYQISNYSIMHRQKDTVSIHLMSSLEWSLDIPFSDIFCIGLSKVSDALTFCILVTSSEACFTRYWSQHRAAFMSAVLALPSCKWSLPQDAQSRRFEHNTERVTPIASLTCPKNIH